MNWILGGLFNKNVLLSGKMLNMLNMLNVLGKTGVPSPIFWFSPRRIQHIQHLPWKKHIFSKMCFLSAEMLNMLNSGGACWIKDVLLSGEMLNMLNVLGKAWGHPPFPYLLALSKSFNIFNISSERSTFSQKKTFLSAEMLNMLNSGGPVE